MGFNKTPICLGKHAAYQHLVCAVVNLIFSTVWVTRKVIICILHNDLRDQTANMMLEVCKDTEIEPNLTLLSGEELQDRTSNSSNKERADIRTRGFWEQGQPTFYGL